MKYKLLRDLVAVRELPAPKDSEIIIQIDNPNKRRETVINGIVEQVGPKCKGVSIGDKVWFEIEMGKARLPWDEDVRIMAEDQIAFIEAPYTSDEIGMKTEDWANLLSQSWDKFGMNPEDFTKPPAIIVS